MFAKTTVSVLVFIGAVSAQNIPSFSNLVTDAMSQNIIDTAKDAVAPLKEHLEPFKTHESTRQRGVPIVHQNLGK